MFEERYGVTIASTVEFDCDTLETDEEEEELPEEEDDDQ